MRNKQTIRLALAAIAATALLLTACGSSGSDGASDQTTESTAAPAAPAADDTTTPADTGDAAPAGGDAVTIKGFAFDPTPLKVKAGAEITFTNEDSASHTATSDEDGVADTGTLKKGESATVTFDKPGTYKYHCEIHPTMTAEIDVS